MNSSMFSSVFVTFRDYNIYRLQKVSNNQPGEHWSPSSLIKVTFEKQRFPLLGKAKAIKQSKSKDSHYRGYKQTTLNMWAIHNIPTII